MRKIFCVIAALSVFALNGWAQEDGLAVEPVTGEALQNAFSGVTMDGIYKQARERSGTHHFTETFNTNGTTEYREGDITDTGRWAANENTICFRYSGPLSGGLSCFRVFKSGTCYYSYNPKNIRNGAPIDTNRWSAKTIIRGDVSTCDNLAS